MAFIRKQLRNGGRPIPLSNTKVIRFLTYATNDAKAEVIAPGYFNNGRADLSVGSIIDAEVDCDGVQASVKMRVATMPDGGNITVTDITPT